LKNESSNEYVIQNRIIKYNLFDKALDLENYNFIKTILDYKPLHYMSNDYKNILIKVINKYMSPSEIGKKQNIAKLIIENFIENSILIYKNRKYGKSNSFLNFLLNINSCILLKRFNEIPVLINKRYNSSVHETISSYFSNLVLNIAIKQGNLNAVIYLCNKYYCEKNDIIKDLTGEYPIFTAVECDNYDIFEFIIKRIKNQNIKNSNGISLLTFAIIKNKINMVECLLKYENNLNLNKIDCNGFT